jgi:hypothetical protein
MQTNCHSNPTFSSPRSVTVFTAMRLRRLTSTPVGSRWELPGYARVKSCRHFRWHWSVEDSQTLAALTVRFGGEGRNRTAVRKAGRPGQFHLFRSA